MNVVFPQQKKSISLQQSPSFYYLSTSSPPSCTLHLPLSFFHIMFVSKQFLILSTLLSTVSTVFSAPTGSVTITVKNNCNYSAQVNQLTNDAPTQSNAIQLSSGDSTDISVASTWGGRIWARKECTSTTDCNASAPASLAEFLMSGANGSDYYDVSLVDGFNIPMSISPNGKSGSGYNCGIPDCSSLPTCPPSSQIKDANGNVIACESSCKDCATSAYVSAVKLACPQVYAYSSDDKTSMFS
ncbi:thaumatin [Spinellus fusiger]|nr:thaumatin [Spinellus fusiger]